MGFFPVDAGFVDQPELLHRINSDLLAFNQRLLKGSGGLRADICHCGGGLVVQPRTDDFQKNVRAVYRPVLSGPAAAAVGRNIPVFMDTDGDVSLLVPWLKRVGTQACSAGTAGGGRRAGVAQSLPRSQMIGHFDKMTMNTGADVMRREFERLLPLMRSGRFIPVSITKHRPGCHWSNTGCT